MIIMFSFKNIYVINVCIELYLFNYDDIKFKCETNNIDEAIVRSHVLVVLVY